MSNMDELAIFKQKLGILDESERVVSEQKHNLIDLENAMLKLPQVECTLTHNFAHGVYVRELHIPKDTIIMGKRHRFETCNIVLTGALSIYMGEDEPIKKIKAPCIFNTQSGAKKLGYTHEDTIFLNIIGTSERDIQKIEEEFIITEKEFIKEMEAKKCLLSQQQ